MGLRGRRSEEDHRPCKAEAEGSNPSDSIQKSGGVVVSTRGFGGLVGS